MPRFALSDPSIGSTTTSGSASPPRRPTSSETTSAGSIADPSEDHVLRGLVDRGRVVAAEPRAHHGLALDAGRQAFEHGLDVRDRGPAQLQPISHSSSGSIRRPDVSFG